MRDNSRKLRAYIFCALLNAFLCAAAHAAQPVYHIDTFDRGRVAWEVRYAARPGRRPQTLMHERRAEGFMQGLGAEHLGIQSGNNGQSVRLALTVPPARVIPDLSVKLSMRCSRPGAVLALQIVFPNATDPQTGRTLRVLVKGDEYGLSGDWQELTCRTTEKKVNDALWRIRNKTRQKDIDTNGAYVDSVMVFADLSSGKTNFTMDRVEFGPIVPARKAAEDKYEPDVEKLVKFRVGQVFVHDKPFFPLFTPHFNESAQTLSDLSLNSVWLNEREPSFVEELRQLNMWAIVDPTGSTPDDSAPVIQVSHRSDARSRTNQIDLTAASNNPAPPLISAVDPILCWYLGTQLKRGDQKSLIEKTRLTAGRSNGVSRPFMADVAESERIMSRHVDMLGVSRHLIGTSLTYHQFRKLIGLRRNLALAGSFVWTWIQTEPVPGQKLWREELGRNPVVIEPEQIRLQVYSALAAGCRAIGFWKTDSFDLIEPGSEERRLMISQLNMEIQMLEEWLASGHLDGQIEFEVDDGVSNQPITTTNNSRRNAPGNQFSNLFSAGQRKPKKPKNPNLNLEAAVIRTKDGMLLLPVWYERDAQFVPGSGSAPAIKFVAPPFARDAIAYAVTTTGIQPLRRKIVSGGLEITLPDFDLTAAVIVTTRTEIYQKLRERARRLAPKSASVYVGLAQAKLDRVKNVEVQLNAMAPDIPIAEVNLARAERLLIQAEAALQQQDYVGAVRYSKSVMQNLRSLQRAHWDTAIAGLSSPLTSPHTQCFQTLPDHWSVQSVVSSHDGSATNLLKGGDFETEAALVSWEHKQAKIPKISAGAELYGDSAKGNFCLRLLATPERGEDAPEFVARSPVTMTSAPVNIQKGQIVEITGLVRVPYKIHGSFDGAMIYDSIGGKASALRWNKTEGWQRFRFLREVPYDGAFTLNFVLDGLGSMQIDDVRVSALGRVASQPKLLSPGESFPRLKPQSEWSQPPIEFGTPANQSGPKIIPRQTDPVQQNLRRLMITPGPSGS